MENLLKVALSQYGVKEVEGSKHNQTVVSYAKEIGLTWVNDDETPWCSIFMNWCAMKAGLQRTSKANARSWLDVGQIVLTPEVGDVVIFKRGDNPVQGHVALFIAKSGNAGYIYVLGGNQSDQVMISQYAAANILGFRRLNKV